MTSRFSHSKLSTLCSRANATIPPEKRQAQCAFVTHKFKGVVEERCPLDALEDTEEVDDIAVVLEIDFLHCLDATLACYRNTLVAMQAIAVRLIDLASELDIETDDRVFRREEDTEMDTEPNDRIYHGDGDAGIGEADVVKGRKLWIVLHATLRDINHVDRVALDINNYVGPAPNNSRYDQLVERRLSTSEDGSSLEGVGVPIRWRK